jgi:hypothetical protein
MARRKQAAAASAELAPETPSQPVEQAPAQMVNIAPQERKDEPPARLLTPDPFTLKTVNAGGQKVQFQHSRQSKEFQIRFGDGSKEDMPSDAVRDYIKSHKVEVENREGEKREVQRFHWNEDDRAWGMRIDRNDPETSRQIAKRVYDQVVEMVTEERKEVQSPTP